MPPFGVAKHIPHTPARDEPWAFFMPENGWSGYRMPESVLFSPRTQLVIDG
jgi:hypothetical protein